MNGSCAGRDGVRQRRVGRLQREIFLAGKVTDERPALMRDMIADRAAQHRIAGLERVEDRGRRHRVRDI